MDVILSWTFYIVLAVGVLLILKISNECKSHKIRVFKSKSVYISVEKINLFVILWAIAVFRKVDSKHGGADAISYLDIFDISPTSLSDFVFIPQGEKLLDAEEPLFGLFNAVIHSLTNSHLIYFMIVYGIIVWSLLTLMFYFFDSEKLFLPAIMFIGFYLSSFNIIRTWLSISMCIYAFINLDKKNYIKSLCWTIAGSLIHYMGFSFLLVWLIGLLDDKWPDFFNRKRLLFIAGICNFIPPIIRPILMSMILNTKYAFYKDYFSMEISLLGHIPVFLICFVAIWNFGKAKTNRDRKIILALSLNLDLMYVIVYMFAWRLNDYFSIFRVLFLATPYLVFVKKNRHDLYRVCFDVFILVLFFQQLKGLNESSKIVPYIIGLY